MRRKILRFLTALIAGFYWNLLPAMANDSDRTYGPTDLYVIYKDSGGYTLGEQKIKKNNDGDLVDYSELTIPDGFSLEEPWMGTKIVAGDYGANRIELYLTANNPQIQDSIHQQPVYEPGYIAATLNYVTAEGTVMKSDSFRTHLRPSAGGAGGRLALNEDYWVHPPVGYTLAGEAPQFLTVSNAGGRILTNLLITPGNTDSSSYGDHSAPVTIVHCDFYTPDGNVLWIQDIPFFGEGEVRVTQDLLQLPEGYQLNQAWQDYVTQAGQDLDVDIQIVRKSATSAGSSTAQALAVRTPGADTAVNSGLLTALSAGLTSLAAGGILCKIKKKICR